MKCERCQAEGVEITILGTKRILCPIDIFNAGAIYGRTVKEFELLEGLR